MNKRMLPNGENDNDSKSGVKRYMMNPEDQLENNNLQNENNNYNLNNSENGIKEENYIGGNNHDISNNINCDENNNLNFMINNSNDHNNYAGLLNIESIGNSNPNYNNNNNNNNEYNINSFIGKHGMDNNRNGHSYYTNEGKKRKGSRYAMPFLKKEKNNVNNMLVLKNVPSDTDEEDIKSLIRPFVNNKTPDIIFNEEGVIIKLYDDDLQENIFNYFKEHPTQIKGSFFEIKLTKINDDISSKGILENHKNNNGNMNSGYGNNEYNNGLYDMRGSMEYFDRENSKDNLNGHDKRNSKYNKNECSKVILVSVVNMQYPVDIELIYYLFSKCGAVEKIITISKKTSIFQALVQLESIEVAKEAIKTLHNRNIYDGCNTLQIQYSFLKELIVKNNNSQSWDYTTSNPQRNKNSSSFQNSHGVLPTPTRNIKETELYKLLERKFKIVDFETKNTSKTPVLICYNIPKEYTDVNKLFNLFSVYGYVSRIKILREKPDSALIQYSNYLFSSLAQECLQHAKICQNILELHFSKIYDIKISYQDKNRDSYKAKFFSNHDQRYGMSDQLKYVKGACKPTKTLFISNVSEEVTEECIIALFNKYDEINKFKSQPIKEGKKNFTATIEMNSEDTATKALMDLHNFQLKDRCMKVSFTKTKLP
ncbi:polypyrimidine tract-binding protein, putative [Plasmodium vinckei vinckei]|uniref:Polypyrimidine tract-binding protein, putative n=1 Tax=Plasmodium vinckei vinckei TaxID=54757 RepID=A0A081I9E3_PLAVN|nr:polypyrimidine tract-binding protein, putative [Plasmodium vinckei vinckei]KEG00301.1 hypothetical protein YYE_04812 [Plasmodium vinckei vinckei]VEV54454.1 polypyrimidine tract-binding protein, putative [Plasmodium vinckei vinckei]